MNLNTMTNPSSAHFPRKGDADTKPKKETTPPLCIHCRWFQAYFSADARTAASLATCERSRELLNPVTGHQTRGFCENERGAFGDCGPDGKHFLLDNCETAA